MTDQDSLYRELKSDVEKLAIALFDVSQVFVRQRGAFLPHGALLVNDDVRMVMAAADTDRDQVSATEVLPNLHFALSLEALQNGATALAVCEDVRITTEGNAERRAIKVLVEHQRGLCVAVYMPFHRRLLRYRFDDAFATSASPEVRVWSNGQIKCES